MRENVHSYEMLLRAEQEWTSAWQSQIKITYNFIWRGIEVVITGLTRKRLGFVTRYSVKAPVFSQKLRFPAVFATLDCRKRTNHLSVFYQSSRQFHIHIRRGIEAAITRRSWKPFERKLTWVRIPSSPPIQKEEPVLLFLYSDTYMHIR